MHIRKISGQRAELSLDEPINTDYDGNELLLSDILGTDGDTVMRPMEDDVDHQLLREALARLPDRERTIMVLRYGLEGTPEKTQKEVAELMGISQSYISRLGKANHRPPPPGDHPADPCVKQAKIYRYNCCESPGNLLY